MNKKKDTFFLIQSFVAINFLFFTSFAFGNFVTVAKKALPAVVNISSTKRTSPSISPASKKNKSSFYDLYNTIEHPKERSLGSGFIISQDGYVVTNRHVVDKVTKVTITTNSGKEYKAKVIGKDIRTDIALLKILNKKKNIKYPYLRFANSKTRIQVGEWVLVIGNPFGLGGSVTAGIVSSKSRNIASRFDLTVGNYVNNLIQTDASINFGNSGGPMLNTKGQVIGVNFAILSPSGESVGIGFAVPASVVQKVVKQIKQKGYVVYGWLGVQVQEVTDEIAQSVSLPHKRGAIVVSLTEGGPGEKGGLQEGDVILKAGSKIVESYEQVPRISGCLPVNKTSSFLIWRNGKEKKLPIFIEEIPANREEKEERQKPKSLKNSHTLLGITVLPLRPLERVSLNIPEHISGLVVKNISLESPAGKADLRAGDVLMKAEGQTLLSISDLEKIIKKAKKSGKKALLIKINRQGEKAYKGITL